MADTPYRFPSVQETLNHPAYPGAVWALEPHRHGRTAVAKNRGGTVHMAWEIHGSGPVKLVLITGLGAVKASWQRQTRYFGHDRADVYSVLLLDNRGMGASDKPLGRYSTSEMARDVVDVLDHVGWTRERQLHVVGISLGGMIAQELACAVPRRLGSLSLLCTSAHVQSSKSFLQTLAERLYASALQPEESAIADTAHQLFVDAWLGAPDAEALPSPDSTPRCAPPRAAPDDGYRRFDSNFQRYQAQELAKRRDGASFTLRGVLCQFAAAAGHRKSDAQLRNMADAVGRERILVMHGTADSTIGVVNGEKLIEVIEPGVGLVVDGMGHVPMIERAQWFNELLAEKLEVWSKLDDRDGS